MGGVGVVGGLIFLGGGGCLVSWDGMGEESALGNLFLLHYLNMTERFSERCLRLLPFYCIILS